MTGNNGFKNTPFFMNMQILYLFDGGSSSLFKVTISYDFHKLHSKQNSPCWRGSTLNNTFLTKKGKSSINPRGSYWGPRKED